MNMRRSFLLVLFLGIYCGYSSALVCYVCQNCADPADVNTYTNNTCPGPCMKISTYIPTMGGYIYKACTTQCTEQSRYFGFSTFQVKCCNNTDRCNTAPKSHSSAAHSLLTYLCAIISYLILK